MPPNHKTPPNLEPEVVWHEDDNILVVDGEEFRAEGDPPRADVRVGVLRRLRGHQLPAGLEVRAVRRVAGSRRDFFPEEGCPTFSRDGGVGTLLVEEAVIVDEEDDPNPESRAGRLRQEVREVLEQLADLKRDGKIDAFEAGGEYPEDGLAYWSCMLTVGELGRGVYEIMTDTPELALLPGRWSDLHPGLTLTFDTRLHRFDATAFDALIAEVLGPDTDVTIEERSNLDAEGPAFIRINGARLEDLVAVAEAFYDRAWARSENVEEAALRRTMTAMEVLFGPRLDRMRDDLSAVKASTNLFADEDVREAITDKAAEHIAAKRKREFSTRTQRLIAAVASEVKKRTVDLVVGEGVADTAIEIAGEMVGDALRAIEDSEVARFERKLMEADEDGS